MSKHPRLTKAVRDGWDNIHAFITCELEAAQAHQFECSGAKKMLVEEGDAAGTYQIENADPEICPCEGCTNRRHAWAAIDWINYQMDRRR